MRNNLSTWIADYLWNRIICFCWKLKYQHIETMKHCHFPFNNKTSKLFLISSTISSSLTYLQMKTIEFQLSKWRGIQYFYFCSTPFSNLLKCLKYFEKCVYESSFWNWLTWNSNYILHCLLIKNEDMNTYSSVRYWTNILIKCTFRIGLYWFNHFRLWNDKSSIYIYQICDRNDQIIKK